MFIGVDVGSSSARAVVVNADGPIGKPAVQAIKTWQPEPLFYEQSSEDIWDAVCRAVQLTLEYNRINPGDIEGIGFCATCSLVVLDSASQPISISKSGTGTNNVIKWCDHRAIKQAESINSTKHPVLQFVGGSVSAEMELPKILWLKENLPENYHRMEYMFDLPDYLTFRATGSLSRSFCTVVCKWNYVGHENSELPSGWNRSFLDTIGLGDLDGDKRLGVCILKPGQPVGKGLTSRAALELGGLRAATPVGTSLIDAHCGGIGMLGVGDECPLENRLALIAGTSICHMMVSKTPIQMTGIWGPYYSAMVPGWFCNEGGQSAGGELLRHIIETHPAYSKLDTPDTFGRLHEILKQEAISSDMPITWLSKDLHMTPDFNGNRSPFACPTMKGVVSGLDLQKDSISSLAILYLAALQSLAYGTKMIIDKANDSGYEIRCVIACGGLCVNNLFLQTLADVLQVPVVVPAQKEAVLVGAAILGAVASKSIGSIQDAMMSPNKPFEKFIPDTQNCNYHTVKYEIFTDLVLSNLKHVGMMSNLAPPSFCKNE
uniref:FGGY carbohydrate kinase domain-containing protein n=1 Tax=Mucochytrium quahogii TaxID=96639 RepID=A0A7S2WSK4_9STRA|mmetsp:Transcript_1203/g.1440  ORF Transcript_1203/g.1440 Transcript_1203/m.1440 type:complete len:546 (-) Transcript_1203:1048-2685(-)|eukprot:CAMPEP_0203762774 /NCGR_PEP_ID=MMETSP0098-20131031/15585_1 /ASSEMBLY_ACC=CAM_ASM_000208 /TAXON_ID=96639 /ORGANISM=" , Strain NY0313808BC1" /LENGTH=545 /DNA_ID=CAMNT_0050657315 /DNA_START=144 /DNA_END=1781 /DNA_ORIENTATION=+